MMSRQYNYFISSIVFALLACFVLAGCAINPATGRTQLALMSMSDEEEAALGNRMFPGVMQKMGGEYPDAELQSYIQSVGDRLKEASHRKNVDYTFKVVNDSTPNAFAMPGGYIAISRGLLVNLESEEQLAAVLGHEVGHVDARHALQGLQRSNLLGLGLAVLSGAAGGSQYAGLIRSSSEIAATLVDRTYSRAQESESDRLGIDYMIRSGYHPSGAVELQQIFYQKIDKNRNPQWLEGIFRTHPFSKKRMDENRRYIESGYASAKFPLKPKTSFLEATERLRLSAPAYEQFDRARQSEKEDAPEKAVEYYLQAAELAPGEALILTGLGLAYLRLEDLVPARQHLQRAVRLDDNYYMSRLGLAYTYLMQKDYSRAIRHAEKSFELLPTVQSVYFSARGYDGTGQENKALELYRVVVENAVGSKMGQEALARIKEIEGK